MVNLTRLGDLGWHHGTLRWLRLENVRAVPASKLRIDRRKETYSAVTPHANGEKCENEPLSRHLCIVKQC